jgi:hypothetical protein
MQHNKEGTGGTTQLQQQQQQQQQQVPCLAFLACLQPARVAQRLSAAVEMLSVVQVQVQASTAAANPPISLSQRALLQTAARRRIAQQQVRSRSLSGVEPVC